MLCSLVQYCLPRPASATDGDRMLNFAINHNPVLPNSSQKNNYFSVSTKTNSTKTLFNVTHNKLASVT